MHGTNGGEVVACGVDGGLAMVAWTSNVKNSKIEKRNHINVVVVLKKKIVDTIEKLGRVNIINLKVWYISLFWGEMDKWSKFYV